ncbi:MAG: GDP-mannose 4,6-dehydratase [bacterium]|nr:GDP-mannose 4,6-dehydratase [bacterium]
MKCALITGVNGQDGSYLAEFLLKKGYHVVGLVRRASTFNRWRLDTIHHHFGERHERFRLEYGDLNDSSSVLRVLSHYKPDEIYNLAAQSHVQVSFETPEYTANVDALGTLRIVEAIRILGLENKTRLYQASTSELYGSTPFIPQNEETPFHPRSPYGVAKLYAYWIIKNYREAYNIFAVNGILFNHESPRRGENFVTKKITQGLVRVKLNMQSVLQLGNLEAKRDWGYAKEYVEAMWLMLQHPTPEDLVIATGSSHTVREFIEEACRNLNIDLVWKGTGIDEKGIDAKTGKIYIEIDPHYFRPSEVDHLQGDASKAEQLLGWKPKTTFKELVRLMTEHDLKLISREKMNGFFENR